MITIEALINNIGREKMRRLLGVQSSSISNCIGRKHFPAAWYSQIKARCDELGIECPMELFNFKEPAEPEEVSE